MLCRGHPENLSFSKAKIFLSVTSSHAESQSAANSTDYHYTERLKWSAASAEQQSPGCKPWDLEIIHLGEGISAISQGKRAPKARLIQPGATPQGFMTHTQNIMRAEGPLQQSPGRRRKPWGLEIMHLGEGRSAISQGSERRRRGLISAWGNAPGS